MLHGFGKMEICFLLLSPPTHGKSSKEICDHFPKYSKNRCKCLNPRTPDLISGACVRSALHQMMSFEHSGFSVMPVVEHSHFFTFFWTPCSHARLAAMLDFSQVSFFGKTKFVFISCLKERLFWLVFFLTSSKSLTYAALLCFLILINLHEI